MGVVGRWDLVVGSYSTGSIFNTIPSDAVPPLAMFENYLYISSASETLKRHFYELSAELTELGLKPLPSVGNFLLVGFGSKERAAAANDWMMNDGLIPRMVAGYGLPEHLRITIGTESEVKAVQESLGRLVAANK